MLKQEHSWFELETEEHHGQKFPQGDVETKSYFEIMYADIKNVMFLIFALKFAFLEETNTSFQSLGAHLPRSQWKLSTLLPGQAQVAHHDPKVSFNKMPFGVWTTESKTFQFEFTIKYAIAQMVKWK